MKYAIATIALLVLPAVATAANVYAPSLVADTDTRPATTGSDPRDFLRLGGEVYFSAKRPGMASGIFALDTASTQLRLVADLAPGARGSLPRLLGVVGNRLIAAANVGEGNTWPSERLWSVDPQSGQFTALTAQPPGVFGTLPLGVVNDHAIFANYSAGELWSSDGTPAGTLRLFQGGGVVVDPYEPHTVCLANDKLMFTRKSGAGLELWRSDGTLAGQSMVQTLPDAGNTATAVAHGGICYFATRRSSGWGLWSSDGTVAGTALRQEAATGSPAGLAATASAAFLLSTDASGAALWRAGQSLPVAQLPVDAFGLVATPTHVAFTVIVNGSFRLMVSDGSAAPPQTVLFNGSPLSPGVAGPAAGPLLFARANSDLYSIDAAQATASLVAGGGVNVFGAANSTLHADGVAYGAGVDNYGNEVWRSDGTAAGTGRLHDVAVENMGGMQFGGEAIVRDDVVYFNPSDSVVGGTVLRGLWRSDGTAAGTYALARDRYDAGNVGTMGSFDGGVVFTSRVSPATRAYRVDPGFSTAQLLFEGTGETSRLLGNESLLMYACGWTSGSDSLCARRSGETQSTIVAAAAGVSTFKSLQTIGNVMIYFHRDALWRSDGTAPGTFALASLRSWQYWWLPPPPPLPPSPQSQLFGGRLYFQGCTASDVATCGLYATDGIGVPERLATVSGNISYLTTHEGRLAFVASPTGQPTPQPGQLWFSGGTPQTTAAAMPMREGARPLSAGGLLHFSDQNAYFVTDGTPAGTRQVVLPGGAFPTTAGFMRFGDDVLFSCLAPGHGQELCFVNAAGTAMGGLIEIAPGAEYSYAELLVAAPSAIYLSANDGVHGVELWRLVSDRIFASGYEQ